MPIDRCSALWNCAGLFIFGLLGAPNFIEASEPMTIVAMGDSTTAGTPAFRSPVESPPNGSGDKKSQYAYWMMLKHPEWKVLNRGIRGQRSDQIRKRLEADLIEFHPQVLIVLAGVNDLYQGHSVKQITDNLAAMYEKGIEKGIQVVACTVLPYNSMTPEVFSRMKEVNSWIRSRAETRHLGFCDLYSAGENPRHPGNLIGSPDGLHPDVDGYRRMGEALTEVLEKFTNHSPAG